MTSLKVKNANEIMQSLSDILGDSKFTNIFKEASCVQCADDEEEKETCDVCNKEECDCSLTNEEEKEECDANDIDVYAKVAGVVIKELVKMADTLDSSGFKNFADVLDEAAGKLKK